MWCRGSVFNHTFLFSLSLFMLGSVENKYCQIFNAVLWLFRLYLILKWMPEGTIYGIYSNVSSTLCGVCFCQGVYIIIWVLINVVEDIICYFLSLICHHMNLQNVSVYIYNKGMLSRLLKNSHVYLVAMLFEFI